MGTECADRYPCQGDVTIQTETLPNGLEELRRELIGIKRLAADVGPSLPPLSPVHVTAFAPHSLQATATGRNTQQQTIAVMRYVIYSRKPL